MQYAMLCTILCQCYYCISIFVKVPVYLYTCIPCSIKVAELYPGSLNTTHPKSGGYGFKFPDSIILPSFMIISPFGTHIFKGAYLPVRPNYLKKISNSFTTNAPIIAPMINIIAANFLSTSFSF